MKLKVVDSLPSWLRVKIPSNPHFWHTKAILKKHHLNTVCEEAKCPNRLECYSKKTATFLALGKACTRRCAFCDIDFSKTPLALDPQEPENIAAAVQDLGLSHVVITMVARDDLPDGGACRMAEIIHAVKSMTKCTVEVLTSDFQGNQASLQLIAQAAPSIFNHNLETVARLSKRIRHTASYERSLACLSWMKQHSTAWIKSGLMLGLGEEESEVHSTLQDLKQAGCDIVTMGQYLRPSHHQCVVKEFITPQQFEAYAHYGKSIGIEHVYAAPFVRSSYNAAAVFDLLQHQK